MDLMPNSKFNCIDCCLEFSRENYGGLGYCKRCYKRSWKLRPKRKDIIPDIVVKPKFVEYGLSDDEVL